MFKIIVCLFLVLALVCATIKTEDQIRSRDRLNEYEAGKAFDELEDHLKKKVSSKDPKGLIAARKLIPKRDSKETYIQRAARIYVYLNEFDQCEPKAIGYIYDVLRGRPDAVGLLITRSKTQFERLLETTLERASGKCKSFVETWFRETESKLEPNSKKLLYEYITHDVVKPGKSYNSDDILSQESASKKFIESKVYGHQLDIGRQIAHNAIEDENLYKQLSGYDTEQLKSFFHDNFDQRVIKPCRNYRDVMWHFFASLKHYGFGNYQKADDLFYEPSQDLLDSRYRLNLCKTLAKQPSTVNSYGAQFVFEIQQRKKLLLNGAE